MKKIVGIAYGYNVENGYDEIRELGFSWTRMGVCFPWEDCMFGTLSENYVSDKRNIKEACEHGLQVMISTPGMGGYFYSEQDGQTCYRDSWPDFVGEKGSTEYYRNVAAACEFVCNDLREFTGEMWQCMNEIDIPTFSGDYSLDVVVNTARASAEGIVRANPDAKCGINLSRYHEDGLKVADLVYAPGHCFSYIGDDQYFGSWQGRDVEEWNTVIDALYERYKLPVLANEWGYSSGGRVMEKPEDLPELKNGIPNVCWEKSWFHAVEGGHTQEVQADYLRRGLEIFAQNPRVMGSFLFCFKDAAKCYHCGESDCPSECYWGIVDVNGKPKKAYAAVKKAIKDYYKDV